LTRHTSSPVSWFLLWDGFGNLNQRAFNYRGAKVSHPMRDYYLLRGPHLSYAEFPDNPNYWWPEDRAWCVVTDTDVDWAYVARSSRIAAEGLEAWGARPVSPQAGP
jgi:hypothetical protein